MSHAFVKVYIHFVWSTKYGKRILLGDSRELIKKHIEQYAADNSIAILRLAVQPEHIHLLTWLQRTQRIEDIVKLIKGESSYWINQQKILRPKFSWQRGYWGGSVSFQDLSRVIAYIENQDEHHRARMFKEEVETILRRQGYSDEETRMMMRQIDS